MNSSLLKAGSHISEKQRRVTVFFRDKLLIQQLCTCDVLCQKPEHRQTLTHIHLLEIFRICILDISVLANLNTSESFNYLNLKDVC